MRETGSATVSCTVGPVQCAQIVILLAIGSDQSRGALRPGGVAPARCAPFIGLLAIGFGQSRGAPRSGGTGPARCAQLTELLAIGSAQSRGAPRSGRVARPDTLRSPHSLRSALASLEEPYGLEGSAGPIRSDRRTPCDRPRAISRSPTIRTGPPGPTFQRPEKTRHLGEAAYDFSEAVSLSSGGTFNRPEKTRHFDDRACSFSETVSLLGGKRRQSSVLLAEQRRNPWYFRTINPPTKVIRAYIYIYRVHEGRPNY